MSEIAERHGTSDEAKSTYFPTTRYHQLLGISQCFMVQRYIGRWVFLKISHCQHSNNLELHFVSKLNANPCIKIFLLSTVFNDIWSHRFLQVLHLWSYFYNFVICRNEVDQIWSRWLIENSHICHTVRLKLVKVDCYHYFRVFGTNNEQNIFLSFIRFKIYSYLTTHKNNKHKS